MRFWSILAFTALLANGAAAQQHDAPRCDRPEYRQFDFWIGEWRVESQEGEYLGTNTISRNLADCVLLEHWRGRRGLEGKSFNTWDRVTGRWHQTWVDSSGLLLLLDGGLAGESMRLEGEGKRPDGSAVRQRITWTPLDREDCRGCVRQLWEQAAPGGEWEPVFDGIYRPATAAE
ncbi:MAG: hypothetical protein ACRD2J_13705 [Thermoanaerobaculia bacterium]